MEVTTPQSPLVARVERRIRAAYCGAPRWTRKDDAWRAAAQAAIEACRAEEMRRVLEILVYAKEMKKRSGDTPAYRAKKEEGWTRARAVLAEMGRV